jgi:ankyrin repeat protein
MKKHLLWLVVCVLMRGSSFAWAGNDEDLLKAIESGRNDEVERMLDAGADVFATNAAGSTPMHMAAMVGNRKVAELLIARHANVNARTRPGVTPLHFASYHRHMEVTRLLLEQGAEVNAAMEYGYTPLFKAVEPEKLDGGILPALTPAAAIENKALVVLLLEKGAKVNVKLKDGVTPLHFAAMLGVPDIVELLIAGGAQIDAEGNGVTPLFMAAKFDRKEVAETLLAHGANIDMPSDDGMTPLVVAADYGNASTVELLLRKGANANIQAGQWPSLLMDVLAVELRMYEIVVKKAYAPSSPWFGKGSMTPAEKAAFEGGLKGHKGEWPAVTKLLVTYGANVNVVNGGGTWLTPLYLAATIGDRDLVELLLAKGANANGDISGRALETPLHSAIAEKHREIVELLIMNGANVNALNLSKRTPLHFLASFIPDGTLAELMIGKGAEVNARDKNGEIPYVIAVRVGNQEVAKVLQRHGARQ